MSKLYASFHEQLPWIHELFGGTIDKLTAITYLLGHSAFFVLACFGVLFVNAPRFTRVLLLFIVPLNCFTALHECCHLSYTQISWLLALSVPGKQSSFSSLDSGRGGGVVLANGGDIVKGDIPDFFYSFAKS